MKKISPETWRNYKFAGEEDGKELHDLLSF